jgi:hypothetical protein
MTLQGQQFVARYGVPDLAGSVVTAGDEFVARLVECTVRQWQNVRS